MEVVVVVVEGAGGEREGDAERRVCTLHVYFFFRSANAAIFSWCSAPGWHSDVRGTTWLRTSCRHRVSLWDDLVCACVC